MKAMKERAGAEALFEVLRERLGPVAEVERSEHHRQDQQGERRHPFVVAPHQPGRVTGAAQADQVDCRDVGSEQGGPDHGPPKRTAAEEVCLAGHLGIAGHPQADEDDSGHVGNDDDQIENRDLQ
ncbi:MAG: hypothetical protein R2748_30165 [Bryobacterales bacterium]